MVQVEEIALLNTTLIKWDGSRVLYPNYKMNTDMITNITRSNNKGEVFSVNVDFSTSLEVFAQIEALIKVHSEASPDINAIAVSPGNGGNPLKFTMNIWWEYTFNSKFPGCVSVMIAYTLCRMLCLRTCVVWVKRSCLHIHTLPASVCVSVWVCTIACVCVCVYLIIWCT